MSTELRMHSRHRATYYNEIADLYHEGMQARDIARKLGLDLNHVIGVVGAIAVKDKLGQAVPVYHQENHARV